MDSRKELLKNTFKFGSDKVSRTIREYKRLGKVPEPVKASPKKLTAGVLAIIHEMFYGDAHSTLEMIQKTVQERLEMSIAISTIARGCATQIKNRFNSHIKKTILH